MVLEGGDALLSMLKQSGEQAGHVLGEAIFEEAHIIFAKAQVLTPIDTGALRGSGGVSAPGQEGGGGIYVDIFYGGTAAPYAMYVHELNYKHLAPTQSKFLEQPFMERMPDLQQNLAGRILDMISKESR